MSFDLTPTKAAEVAKLMDTQAAMMDLGHDVPIHTDHVIHAGIYTRTIMIPKGVALMGALIKIPTVLVFFGHAHVRIGGEWIEIQGHKTIPGSAGRKQLFVALEDTYLSMSFPTSARTVEEAEREFTDEVDILMSRRSDRNTVTIPGE